MSDATARRPNVLVFCVDEMRSDHLGCAGNSAIRTPNLDRLASMGTLFSRSYCNNPICMPARTTMFTGVLPRDHGVRLNGQYPRHHYPYLPRVLADAGYLTHACGKLHLTPYVPKENPPDPGVFPESLAHWNEGRIREFPTDYFGFRSTRFVGGHTSFVFGEYIQWLAEHGGNRKLLMPAAGLDPKHDTAEIYKMALPAPLHYNRYISDAAREFIEKAETAEQPFFLWCSFPDPHAPIAPPEPFAGMYDPRNVQTPIWREGEERDLPPFYTAIYRDEVKPNGYSAAGMTEEKWRQMVAGTYGMVSHVDSEIGRIMAVLDAKDMWNNTLVLFLSDHGDMMGDHKLLYKGTYTFDGCIRIPTIAVAPDGDRGRRESALISQVDLLPTILDFCGLTHPGDAYRRVQTPFERGSVRPLDLLPGRSWLGLLDGSVESIRRNVVIENDDPTLGFRVRALVTDRYRLTVYPGTDDGELFDLENDPHELYNLWYRPGRQQTRLELTAELLDAYSEHTPFHPVPPWNS